MDLFFVVDIYIVCCNVVVTAGVIFL